MRKRLKKLTAVVLTAGMFASSLFVNGVTAKAEEATGLKKGTVIYDFKEITDVKDFEVMGRYFLSPVEFDSTDAVAALPEGSAILQFAGTDVNKAVADGTFKSPEYLEISDYVPELRMELEAIEAEFGSYENFRQRMIEEIKSTYPQTEEGVYKFFSNSLGLEITSWEQILEIVGEEEPEFVEAYPTIDDFIPKFYEVQINRLNLYYPEDKEDLLYREIYELPSNFETIYQQQQDGYVAVIQSGVGFDDCLFGTIAYLEELIMPSAETGEENSENSQAGWYYACAYGGVAYVGPFHAYSYKVGEFTEDDLIITFVEDWQTPTAATTVTKDDVKLSVVIDGEEIFIPFFELTDASVDPENNDTTITLTVGDIVKEVEVCNIEPGDVETDVQIGEGAPTVGLEDAVDALKEAVLTEAELKLVGNGVDIDIYMTVVGKEAENVGDDKAAIEKIMGKDDKAVYLDLKLFKKVGNNEPTAISEVPGGKIKVSIEVPDSVKAFAANAKVVRVHGTEVTELTTTYDATTNKLTFETDKFSTYAIVYNESNDADNNNNNNNPDEGNKPGDGGQTPEPPKTGDASMVLLYMAVVAMSGVVVIKRKKITEM